jgi:peptidyl-prolyl cis-trans isomerase C
MKASVLVLVALMGLAACGTEGKSGAATATSASSGDVGDVLATVNGVQIGSKEFETAAARKTPASGDALSLEEKKEVLGELVEEKLLYAEALRQGLDKDPKVQKVMVNTLVREEVFNTLKNSDFPDEVLQKYYEDHKSEFIVPEKVQIKRILIKVTPERADDAAKAEAEKLRAEVAKAPDTFKDVAARYSEDPYKRRGGDVGFVSKEGKPGLDQAIVEKAFALDTNAVSEVFKTEDGYNIIQVAARREQLERTFQQMKGTVLRKAKSAKQQELYDAYVANLKKDAKITTDDAKLGALEIKNARRPFAPGMDEHGEDLEEEGGEMVAPTGEGDAAEGAAVPRPLMPGRPGAVGGDHPIVRPGAKQAAPPSGK